MTSLQRRCWIQTAKTLKWFVCAVRCKPRDLMNDNDVESYFIFTLNSWFVETSSIWSDSTSVLLSHTYFHSTVSYWFRSMHHSLFFLFSTLIFYWTCVCTRPVHFGVTGLLQTLHSWNSINKQKIRRPNFIDYSPTDLKFATCKAIITSTSQFRCQSNAISSLQCTYMYTRNSLSTKLSRVRESLAF